MNEAQRITERLVAHADATGFRAHGLHVRVGADTAQHFWSADVRRELHSVAKGVCVLAAGIADDEGIWSIDAPLAAVHPQGEFGAGVGEVTLRRLLTMSSGIDLPWSETMMTDWPDLTAEFLRRPTRGAVFQYSNASTYTAMTLLAERVGDVAEYLRSRLFTPLGIAGIEWRRCPHGRILAGEGLALRTAEVARIGQLIREGGRWEGARLISSKWIDAMHGEWVPAGKSLGYERYGLAGWDGPGSVWRLHGAHGQLLIFSGDAVVTITADDHFGADAMAAFVADTLTGGGAVARCPSTSRTAP